MTIADFVADARASTPSNAAEIAVPDQREIYRRLDALQTRMVQSEQKRVKALREQFEKTSRSRALQDPMAFIDDKRMLLDYTQKNLAALVQHQMAQRTQQFTALAAKLDALSPLQRFSAAATPWREMNRDKFCVRRRRPQPAKKSRYCSGREVSTAR